MSEWLIIGGVVLAGVIVVLVVGYLLSPRR
jgi:hypothetical protein